MLPVALLVVGFAFQPETSAGVVSAGTDAVKQEEIDAAIQAGIESLLGEQRDDGSFSKWRSKARPGLTALIVYTLLESGVDSDHPSIESALSQLAFVEVGNTYDAACVLMALAAHGPGIGEHREWMQEIVDSMLTWQRGSWGYPSRQTDLSNTQYAALGLRAAVHAGIDVPDGVWAELARSVRSYRGAGGGYAYRPDHGRVTGSMTAAGVGTLAICDEMLTRADALTTKEVSQYARDRERGLEWLAKHFTVAENPGGGPYAWHLYYLYGLERVGALTGSARIGDHDWYAEGAAHLVRTQGVDGGWSSDRVDVTQTCFALLFLSRATHPKTGLEKRKRKHFGVHTDEAPVRVTVTGSEPTRLWIDGFSREILDQLEWPGERGKGLHVAYVVYFSGDHAIGRVRGDVEKPSGLERFAIEHRFRATGTHRVQAQVQAVGPPTEDPGGKRLPGAMRTIESPAFEVEIDSATPEWLLAQADDRSKNHMREGGPRVRASSVSTGGKGLPGIPFLAEYAVDGRLRFPWLADSADERPTLTIDLQQPQRAERILISHARLTPHAPGWFDRAFELQITLNGKDEHRVLMPYDERRKARLELPRPVLLRSIEIVIPTRVPGETNSSVGIAEVEIQR